jgi:cytochrome c5
MKKLLYLTVAALFVIGCANSTTDNETTDTATNDVAQAEPSLEEYDETVGTGKYNADNFSVSAIVDTELAKKGEAIYGAKCQSCHKTTDERLVGPGFKGVSERRTPVWLMNFLTNTNEMIDVDPAMQDELEICMVRMPDQALTEIDAHAFVEFFRKNDGL